MNLRLRWSPTRGIPDPSAFRETPSSISLCLTPRSTGDDILTECRNAR